MHIFRLNTKSRGQIAVFSVLLALSFLFLHKVVFLTGSLQQLHNVLGSIIAVETVHQVELGDLASAKQSEMVLLAVVEDAIESCQRAVVVHKLAIAQETPHLAQGHGEGLLRFGRFNLARVETVPRLEFRVVAEHNVLHFFLYFARVGLEFDQVRDVNQFLERVGLDFFLGGGGCFGARREIGLGSAFATGGRCLGLSRAKVDFAINHAVFIESAAILGAIFESEDTLTLLVVLNPIALVLGPV